MVELVVNCLFCFSEKAGLMDFDQEDVMILLPPLFTTKDFPVNLV